MNEQRRNNEELARQRRLFADAFGRGQANPMDRFGQVIKDGDKLMVRFAVDPVLDVVSVSPVLDPKAPAGLIDVLCTVTFPLRVQAGQPYQGCNIVARRQEVQPQPASDNGNGPKLALVDPSAGPTDDVTEETPDQ